MNTTTKKNNKIELFTAAPRTSKFHTVWKCENSPASGNKMCATGGKLKQANPKESEFKN